MVVLTLILLYFITNNAKFKNYTDMYLFFSIYFFYCFFIQESPVS
jgi:hypothetical protein